MDQIDEKLIELLAKDSNQSRETLAKKLGTSPATIRRRIRKLQQGKVLRFIAAVDHEKIGLNLTAMIALDVDNGKITSVAQLLTNRPEVSFLSTITGRYDIILTARFHSTLELSEFLATELSKLDGVRNSETFICMEVMKRTGMPAPKK